MNKEKYLQNRKALMEEAQNLINNGMLEDANAKMQEIEALDKTFEEGAKAQANINALKDKTVVTDITNKSTNVKGGEIVDRLDNNNVKDENKTYLNAWAKNMMGSKMTQEEQNVFDRVNTEFQNAFTHTTGTTGTLIPETVAAGIWKRAEEMYPLLADVKKFNVKGHLTINKHTSIDEGDAAWYDEATSVADEKNTFGQITLSGCELAKAVTVSWKMKSMSIDEFIPYIQNELGERVGVALGTAIAQGKGVVEGNTSEPLGIETALGAEATTPQIVEYTDADPLAYAKITGAIAKLHSSYLNGAAIYANNVTIWNRLANLLDEMGRPLFIPDVTSGGVGRMFGMVVKPDAGVSADSILIGNANKGYVMNTNEPMSVVTEDHAKQRTTDYVAYTIVDGAPLDTKAFALIKKKAGV